MSFSTWLNTTCTIRRFTAGAADDYGHPVQTFSDLATGIACRLQPAAGPGRGGKEIWVDKQLVIADFKLFLSAGQDVTEKDEIVIGAKTYNVLLVNDAAGHGHHLELDLQVLRE